MQSLGKYYVVCLFLTLSFTAKTQVISKVDWPAFMAQHDLVWEVLPLQWNEGAFVGNGQVGMMVYATLKDNRIDFHIGRQDVTDHRKAPDKRSSMGTPGANVMYDFPRLDIGRMAFRPAGKILSGTIRQDLWNAEIRGEIVTDLGKISFRAFTPYNHDVNIIEATSTEKKDNQFLKYQWEFLPGNPASPRAQVFPENPESKSYQTNPAPLIKTGKGVQTCVQSLLAGGDFATAWTEKKGRKAQTSVLFVSTANEVPRINVSETAAVATVNKLLSLPAESIQKNHRDWWHDFYSQSFLSVPDGRVESFYWIQLYKMASGSRADGPALDLFGPWFRVSQWPGLWWNLNIQLTYWAFLPSNHIDLAQNLIDLIDQKFDAMLPGFEGPRLGDFAWAMHNYWLHYRYLGDWKSIEKKWVPKAMKIALSFEKLQVRRENGKIGLAPMGSPEYKGFVTYPDTNYNLAILRWLLNSLVEVCEKKNLYPAEVAIWWSTLADLVPYPVNENGLMIGSNQPVDMSHRHYSHLLALYPLFQLNPDAPADRGLVEKSVVHWHRIENGKALAGYSYTGAVSLYAALGRGNDANEILQHFLTGNIGISQLLPNTFYVEAGGRNPVIETPLSAAASITEMLLQSWGGKIRIFPAMPDKWKDASFDKLRAQGGFLVSASRKNGTTEWVVIKSLAGEKCLIKVPGWSYPKQKSNGRKYKITQLGNDEFEIDLKLGEEISLSEAAGVSADITAVAHPSAEVNLYGVKKGGNLEKDQSWQLPEYKIR
jgi:alpha-L-fucosidase 2